MKGTRTRTPGQPENDAIKLVRQLEICEWLPSHAIENIFLLNWCVVKSAVLKHTYDVLVGNVLCEGNFEHTSSHDAYSQLVNPTRCISEDLHDGSNATT